MILAKSHIDRQLFVLLAIVSQLHFNSGSNTFCGAYSSRGATDFCFANVGMTFPCSYGR